MPIIGDMRKKGFRGKQYVYGEVVKAEVIPATTLVLHPEPPPRDTRQGRVIKLAKKTVRRLKNRNAWVQGMWMVTTGYNRREY